MNAFIKQMELTFWNIAIPMLTRSQAVRSIIQKSISACQEKKFAYQAGDFPVTADLGRRGLALPFSGMMSEEQVDLVCRTLAECL